MSTKRNVDPSEDTGTTSAAQVDPSEDASAASASEAGSGDASGQQTGDGPTDPSAGSISINPVQHSE